jgi:hypothetical protein
MSSSIVSPPPIRFQVDKEKDGKICVKKLDASEKGDNVVVVNMNPDGSIQTAEPEKTLEDASKGVEKSETVASETVASETGASETGASETGASETGASETGASETGATGATASQVAESGEEESGRKDGENTGLEGGFSMKSLSRGLFGTKKRFMKKSTKKGIRNSATQKKRSIRRNSPTRRNTAIRRKSKRAGKRR